MNVTQCDIVNVTHVDEQGRKSKGLHFLPFAGLHLRGGPWNTTNVAFQFLEAELGFYLHTYMWRRLGLAEPVWNGGIMVNALTHDGTLRLLRRVVAKERLAVYHSLEMRHEDIPDGAVVLRAYPHGLPQTYFGKHPQVRIYRKNNLMDHPHCCECFSDHECVLVMQTPMLVCPWAEDVENWDFSIDECDYALPVIFFEMEVRWGGRSWKEKLVLIRWYHAMNLDAMPVW